MFKILKKIEVETFSIGDFIQSADKVVHKEGGLDILLDRRLGVNRTVDDEMNEAFSELKENLRATMRVYRKFSSILADRIDEYGNKKKKPIEEKPQKDEIKKVGSKEETKKCIAKISEDLATEISNTLKKDKRVRIQLCKYIIEICYVDYMDDETPYYSSDYYPLDTKPKEDGDFDSWDLIDSEDVLYTNLQHTLQLIEERVNNGLSIEEF